MRRWFRFSLRTLFVLLTVCAVWLAWDIRTRNQRPLPIDTSSSIPEADELVELALDQPVMLNLRGKSLRTLPELLRPFGVDAVIDQNAIEGARIALDSPLEPLRISRASLRSALSLALRDLALVATPRDGKLLITTCEQVEQFLTTRVYAVDDLIVTDQGTDSDALVEVISYVIAPSTWSDVGAYGTIVPFRGTISVSHSPAVHRQIGFLLTALRRGRSSTSSGQIWAEDPLEVAAMERFEQNANRRADVDIRRLSLRRATEQIGRVFNLPVVIDRRALEDVGVPPSTVISCRFKQVTAVAAFEAVLDDVDLTIVPVGEVLLFTHRDQAETELRVAIYPVGDLIQSPHDYDSLVQLVATTVHPTSWDEVGGPATVCSFPTASCLAVRQTHAVHQEILRLLTATRRLGKPLPPPVKPRPGGPGSGLF